MLGGLVRCLPHILFPLVALGLCMFGLIPQRSYALSAKASAPATSLNPELAAAVMELSLNTKPGCIKVVDSFRQPLRTGFTQRESPVLLTSKFLAARGDLGSRGQFHHLIHPNVPY
jgi:hypothetical protein